MKTPLKYRSEAAIREVIKRNPFHIKYIEAPNYSLQLLAVSINAISIHYIKCPYPDVQLAAVEQSKYALEGIDYPCEDAILVHKALWRI